MEVGAVGGEGDAGGGLLVVVAELFLTLDEDMGLDLKFLGEVYLDCDVYAVVFLVGSNISGHIGPVTAVSEGFRCCAAVAVVVA